MKLFDRLAIATENNTSGKNKETEVAIYARIGDPNGLTQAANSEEHEQVEGFFKKGSKCRVRKITKNNTDTYVFTIKVKDQENNSAASAVDEYNAEVDKAFFDGFKLAGGEKFVLKTRYVFNSENVELTFEQEGEKQNIVIPNILYEIDVYKKPDGNVSEWCKIDVEVDNILAYLDKEHPNIKNVKLNIKINHLPFKPEKAILASTQDEEQKAFLGNLWDNEFNHKL